MDSVLRNKTELMNLAKFGLGYLNDKGWFSSVVSGGLSRNNEEELPFYTYPAIKFIERITQKSDKVFEYGIGGSSFWWARRVKEVVSVEHNPQWIKNIRKNAPNNLTTILSQRDDNCKQSDPDGILDEFFRKHREVVSGDLDHDIEHGLEWVSFKDYVLTLTSFPKGHFNIIIIDGMARSMAAWLAGQHISDNGVIIFDDSHRWQYNAGFSALTEQGFRLVDFWGPGPVKTNEWCTSIFLKDTSILNRNYLLEKGSPSDLGW